MCFQCRTGQAHLCPRTRILGVDVPGAFADFVVVPEKVVWQNDRSKLPPEIATLQEPFGNAVHSCTVADLRGRVLCRFAGEGPGRHRMEAGPGASTRVIRVDSGQRTVVLRVADVQR